MDYCLSSSLTSSQYLKVVTIPLEFRLFFHPADGEDGTGKLCDVFTEATVLLHHARSMRKLSQNPPIFSWVQTRVQGNKAASWYKTTSDLPLLTSHPQFINYLYFTQCWPKWRYNGPQKWLNAGVEAKILKNYIVFFIIELKIHDLIFPPVC
jgi:hypothetical protein